MYYQLNQLWGWLNRGIPRKSFYHAMCWYILCEDTVRKHFYKNLGNRLPVWSPTTGHKFLSGCQNQGFYSLNSIKEGCNLLASLLWNKNTLCKFWPVWLLTHVLNLLLQKIVLHSCNHSLFFDHTIMNFQVVNKLWGLVEGLHTFRALRASLFRMKAKGSGCSDGRFFSTNYTPQISLENGVDNVGWDMRVGWNISHIADTGKASRGHESDNVELDMNSDWRLCCSHNTDRLALRHSHVSADSELSASWCGAT